MISVRIEVSQIVTSTTVNEKSWLAKRIICTRCRLLTFYLFEEPTFKRVNVEVTAKDHEVDENFVDACVSLSTKCSYEIIRHNITASLDSYEHSKFSNTKKEKNIA